MDPIIIGLVIVAVGTWCAALAAGVMLVRQRRPEIGLLRLCFDGMAWFRRDTFRPEAAPTWRVLVAAAVAFAACIALILLRVLFLV